MNHFLLRILVGGAFVATAVSAMAGDSTVTGTSGQTTLTQTVGSSGWQVADSSAINATITYDDFISVQSGNQSPHGTEFKCVQNSVFGPRTLTGLSGSISDATGSASVSTSGYTTFSSPPPGVPQYYQTNWTADASTSGVGSVSTSGTYDPWSYTLGALAGLGENPGNAIDIYFQVRLGAGSTALPNLGEVGQFRFAAYATQWNATNIPFLTASVTRTLSGITVAATQSSDPNVRIYKLPTATANNDGLDPSAKIAAGTLMGSGGVLTNFTGDLSGIGGMIDDIYFGIVIHDYIIPTGLNSGDVVFATHLDTFASVRPVPEPATVIILSTGFLAVIGRRRRSRR